MPPTIFKCEQAQLCLTLCNAMDFNLPRSSVHGIFQARMLERVTISSRDTPDSGNKPTSHASPALAGKFFTTEPPRKPLCQIGTVKKPHFTIEKTEAQRG